MRYRLTIAYDGTEFHGWQRQVPPEGSELRTVQGVVTDAIVQAVQQPVVVQGASRTDAGVHALGQVAHFDAQTRIPVERLADAINARLPRDVEVLEARPAAGGFDACTDAVEKQYRYRLWTSRRRPLGERHRVYHCMAALNVEWMRQAAAMLIGEHDFAAFAAAGHGRESTIRTITGCEVQRRCQEPFLPVREATVLCDEPWAGRVPDTLSEVHIIVRGGGFLYNMVRIIAGTLKEVGRGRFDPSHIQTLLTEKRRQLAGPTLPPQGLCLEWIRYP